MNLYLLRILFLQQTIKTLIGRSSVSISVIKNQVNNGDNGNDENSPNQLSKDTKDDETDSSGMSWILGIIAIAFAGWWLIYKFKQKESEDEVLDNTPVTNVIVHGDYIDASGGSKVNTGSGTQTDAEILL